MKRAIYSWLASGLLLGLILVLGVAMTASEVTADTLSRTSLILGLVLAIGSFLAFLGLEFRRIVFKQQLTSTSATQAVRQGVEVALFLVGWLLLRMYTELHIWETSLLCLAFVSAEIALSSRRTTGTEGTS